MSVLHPLSLRDIKIDDGFWNRYTNLIPDVVLPYQWETLNDRVAGVPPSYCLQNFKIAAGEMDGERKGTVFIDTDAYKWLEAVAYSLAARPDEALEKTADDVIDLIGRAQADDGYLDTYYTLVEPDGRWQNLTEGHELYCAGHLAEAAVAYYEATGKNRLLKIACRFADLIDSVFGPQAGKLHGYPGHPELELALVRLFRVTQNEAYLRLAKYFIDVRGTAPNYFLEEMKRPGFRHTDDVFKNYDPAYSQSHLPVRQQSTAEGHAVRAVYLYAAMADIAELCGDAPLLEQCKILWRNMTEKRMYITGSIGSSGFSERFTTDYDLPNDSNYSETCASVGLALFGLRMARITRDASYIETVERALYNTVRAGIALEGNAYFYVNPLEVWPAICMEHTSRAHVKAVRQKWFDVACCPTNIARTFTSLGQYIYSAGEDELFVNLFVQNQAKHHMGGKDVAVDLQTHYPKDGNVRIGIKADGAEFGLFIRVPAFAKNPVFSVNGKKMDCIVQKGYCEIRRVWQDDVVELSFGITPELVYANPLVRANVGKVAIVRGPEVYCFEQVDNGEDLAAVYLDASAALAEQWDAELCGGTMVIRCKGKRLRAWNEAGSFGNGPCLETDDVTLQAIPYGLWNNREPGEMIVWVHRCM